MSGLSDIAAKLMRSLHNDKQAVKAELMRWRPNAEKEIDAVLKKIKD